LSCNWCLGAKRVWSRIIEGYEPCPDCHGTGDMSLKLLGPVIEHVTMKDGSIHLCRIELWRRPDGERCFGALLEVLS
jgi:hypothetical protein